MPQGGGYGYQQGPPQGYNGGGYGAPPPGQYGYQQQGAFPEPHASYQSFPSQQAQQQYNAPPPMHYASPNNGPVAQQTGPSAYQGGQFTTHMQPTNNAQMYSNCSGKRKALLIGINYTGTSSALRGWYVQGTRFGWLEDENELPTER